MQFDTTELCPVHLFQPNIDSLQIYGIDPDLGLLVITVLYQIYLVLFDNTLAMYHLWNIMRRSVWTISSFHKEQQPVNTRKQMQKSTIQYQIMNITNAACLGSKIELYDVSLGKF